MQHPDDPLAPYPSIWRTEEVKSLVEDSGSQVVRLDQCAFGAPTKKPTMIMINAPEVDALQLRCGDVPAHTHEVLEGREVDGQFRTRRGMVYPQRLCAALAATLLSGIRRREKPMGTRITVPLADPQWSDPSRWHLLFTTRWQKEEHINVLEARVLVNFGRHLARSRENYYKKVLVFTDSMVALGAFEKGRSSAPSILALCRRMLVLRVATGIRFYIRHIPSQCNSADGPTRGCPVGAAPDTVAKHELRTRSAQG